MALQSYHDDSDNSSASEFEEDCEEKNEDGDHETGSVSIVEQNVVEMQNLLASGKTLSQEETERARKIMREHLKTPTRGGPLAVTCDNSQVSSRPAGPAGHEYAEDHQKVRNAIRTEEWIIERALPPDLPSPPPSPPTAASWSEEEGDDRSGGGDADGPLLRATLTKGHSRRGSQERELRLEEVASLHYGHGFSGEGVAELLRRNNVRRVRGSSRPVANNLAALVNNTYAEYKFQQTKQQKRRRQLSQRPPSFSANQPASMVFQQIPPTVKARTLGEELALDTRAGGEDAEKFRSSFPLKLCCLTWNANGKYASVEEILEWISDALLDDDRHKKDKSGGAAEHHENEEEDEDEDEDEDEVGKKDEEHKADMNSEGSSSGSDKRKVVAAAQVEVGEEAAEWIELQDLLAKQTPLDDGETDRVQELMRNPLATSPEQQQRQQQEEASFQHRKWTIEQQQQHHRKWTIGGMHWNTHPKKQQDLQGSQHTPLGVGGSGGPGADAVSQRRRSKW